MARFTPRPVAVAGRFGVAAAGGAAVREATHEEKADRTRFTLPFVAVLSYLLIEYGRPQDWLPLLNMVHPGAIVSACSVLALVLYRPRAIPRLAKYLFAFLVLMAIGIPFATNNYQAFSCTKTFAIFLLTAPLPIMLFVNSYAKQRTLIRFWIFVNILVAIYGIVHKGRGVGSFLGDENDFCIATNMAAPYAFFLISVARSRTEKVLLVLSLGILLTASVVSWSRGGFLGLVAAGIFCWLHSPRKFASAVAILLVAGVLFVAAPPSYWNEMNTIKTSTNQNDTGYYRLYYWGIAWHEFLDNPILGVGPYNFQFATTPYESDYEKSRGHHMWGRVAHSLYFTLLPEYGIVGVLLYGFIVIAGCLDRARLRKRYRAIVATRPPPALLEKLRVLYYLTLAMDASLVTFLVTGAFISVLYYPHFWLLTAFTSVAVSVFDLETRDVELPRSRPRLRPLATPARLRAPAP